ncbi:MAG: hypothetical protein J6S20_00595, partial [Paludibacteraceae bacterium]|nr:hypothetical protein [Paludibacteraceae bacterium]
DPDFSCKNNEKKETETHFSKYKNHYGDNEKDKGNNIPLTRCTIKQKRVEDTNKTFRERHGDRIASGGEEQITIRTATKGR